MARGNDPAAVWERPEPPERPTLTPLSRDRIVTAAIALADADGLAAVSLRKVASALDAGPMRLYGYLSTKDELLDLMLDVAYAEIVPAGAVTGDWRAELRELASRTRAAALRHEWFVDLVGGRPNIGPHGLAYLETVLSILDRAPGGRHIDDAMHAAGTVQAYLIGALRGEITERRAERESGLTEVQWQVASAPYLRRMLANGNFPTVMAVVRDATHPDRSTTFERGLDYVLDGIAARQT